MAKSGSYGVKELQNEFISIIKKDYPKYATDLLNEMANRTLNRVKKKTPVDTGQLRRSWQIGSIYKKSGDYFVEVFTDVDYAQHMEYGHKLRNGRWQKGVFMLTLSIKELEKDMPKLVKKFYNKLLKELKL